MRINHHAIRYYTRTTAPPSMPFLEAYPFSPTPVYNRTRSVQIRCSRPNTYLNDRVTQENHVRSDFPNFEILQCKPFLVFASPGTCSQMNLRMAEHQLEWTSRPSLQEKHTPSKWYHPLPYYSSSARFLAPCLHYLWRRLSTHAGHWREDCTSFVVAMTVLGRHLQGTFRQCG
jgi:hypothetical protein